MKETSYRIGQKTISYNILENGYDIYLNNTIWVTQHEPHIPYPEMSYENGCLKQIEEICNQIESQEDDTEQRLSLLEETLDNILTNVIPVMTESEVN